MANAGEGLVYLLRENDSETNSATENENIVEPSADPILKLIYAFLFPSSSSSSSPPLSSSPVPPSSPPPTANSPSTAASETSEVSVDLVEALREFDNINVVVRVRPPSSTSDSGRKDNLAVNFPAEGQILVTDPLSNQSRTFTFNVVFEPEATQEHVFEYCGIKRLIDMALDGFASTVFAYGQTGSGKTYTLTGHQTEDGSGRNPPSSGSKRVVGIVQLSFVYLFEQMKRRKGTHYVVQVSYLEVYNEMVLDLLNPSTKGLAVRWAKDRGFYAENLFVVECEDVGDLEGVLEEGRKNRSVRSHAMNEMSSRSHTILTITLASETRDPEDPQGYIRRQGKLCLVDLAGSEKTKKTHSKGDTLVEANNINRSLLVLGNCISALSDPKRRGGHIPYRDSTLTKLLADSLSGSGMTLMIACVSPCRSNASETINTLRYASRAKRVKTKPMVRMDPRELLILSLKREVRLLRMENNYLRQHLNLGNGILLGKADVSSRSTPDELGTENESGKDETKEEVTILEKYMQENESLRAENSQLHLVREQLVRDHELVCRENERLLKKLAELGYNRTPIPPPLSSLNTALPATENNNNSTFGIWRSMLDSRTDENSNEDQTDENSNSGGATRKNSPILAKQTQSPHKVNLTMSPEHKPQINYMKETNADKNSNLDIKNINELNSNLDEKKTTSRVGENHSTSPTSLENPAVTKGSAGSGKSRMESAKSGSSTSSGQPRAGSSPPFVKGHKHRDFEPDFIPLEIKGVNPASSNAVINPSKAVVQQHGLQKARTDTPHPALKHPSSIPKYGNHLVSRVDSSQGSDSTTLDDRGLPKGKYNDKNSERHQQNQITQDVANGAEHIER